MTKIVASPAEARPHHHKAVLICLFRKFRLRLESSIRNHLRQPLVKKMVQLRLGQRAESHQFRTEHFPRTEAVGVRQHADGLGHQVHLDGQIRVRYRSAVQAFEIVAHAKHQMVLVPLDHIDIDINVTEGSELGWFVHVMQAWQKLKQLAIVFLIEIHVDSRLFYGTGTIHGKTKTDNAIRARILANQRRENVCIFHLGNMIFFAASSPCRPRSTVEVT
jgi:hypothetical protein